MTRQRQLLPGLILSLAALGFAPRADAADPDALWKIVSDKCVPKAAAAVDPPTPCRLVDLGQRYAVLKDLVGASQYLVISTDRITGIESPALEEPGSPNYWQAAWEAGRFVAESLGKPVPRDQLGLAINSEKGRTQNQLHIHVDCMNADVVRVLHANEAAIGESWAVLPVQLAGHPYIAMRVEADDLASVNPFRLLADGVPSARADMGDETIVVVGDTFQDGRAGFVLLADHADLATGNRGSGEELLDHDCAILKQ